ncbi:quinolinate synthase [Candidatus Parcubacteria bacterium]|nr:MAG: quinolinate synthase [Candidatus Parcubacteria bacterium]
MKALFIGRFQPFHDGHLDAIKQISESEIIIGVGSSQYSETDDNPQSFEERKKNIESNLDGLNLNYQIIAIPDIHNENEWVNHVKNTVGEFDTVYTGNDVVKKLFEEKNYNVKMIKKNINISATEIREEAARLFEKLKKTKRTFGYCLSIAPTTLEINKLKREQDAIILAHSYQTTDIMYGVADFLGDSYGLSKIAAEHSAKKIIFCSVHFMGETAKILSPEKEVLIPAVAGCSLADSITAKDVQNLKEKHPGVPILTYVNTSAEVKAQSDICVTSSNALKIIESLPNDEIIFIPDMLMGHNLQKLTKKKLILWDGVCIVHEQFDKRAVKKIRAQFPHTKILAHYECTPSVIDSVDLVGSTSDMLNYVKDNPSEHYMLITECGITDRVQTEFPNKHIVGSCQLCPYMKKIKLEDILTALKNPRKDQIINLGKEVLQKAKISLDKMMELSK